MTPGGHIDFGRNNYWVQQCSHARIETRAAQDTVAWARVSCRSPSPLDRVNEIGLVLRPVSVLPTWEAQDKGVDRDRSWVLVAQAF